ncbi:MAG: hypothetical protein LBS85_03750 [Clostridiales Family XIII bacterium]|jgi:capsular polysaccharide biosynthesis protein|nr:hypothetical protein [Clostridiales Family XIII bacterium]
MSVDLRKRLFGAAPGLLLILVLTDLATVAFFRIMGSDEAYYMYAFYALVGVTIYLFAKFLGKEIYLLAALPRLLTAGNLTGFLFHLSVDNSDFQNPLKIHAFTLVWIVIFALELAEMLYRRERIMSRMTALGILTVMVFAVVTLAVRGGSGMGMLAENYAGPFSFFLFFYIYRERLDFTRMRRWMNVYLACIIVLALYGMIEYFSKENYFANYFIENIPSTFSREKYRTAGTVGQIIFPQLMLTGCFIARHNVGKLYARAPIYLFLAVAASMSQTRALIVLIPAYVIISEFAKVLAAGRAGVRKIARAGSALILAFAVFAIVLMQTSLGEKITERFLADEGSVNARMLQIEYFTEHFTELRMYGIGGFAETVTLSDDAGTGIISEIPWINLYFEVGIFLLILIAFLLFAVFSGALWFELLLLLAAFSPYTTLTAKNQCYLMFFFIAAYSVKMKVNARQLAEGESAGEERESLRGEWENVRGEQGSPWGKRTRGKRVRVFEAGVVVIALAAAMAVSGIAGASAANGLEKKYRAVADLYVNPPAVNAADSLFLEEQRDYSLRMNKYLADDIAKLAMSGEVMNRMEEIYEELTGGPMPETDFTDKLTVTNVYEGRIVRIRYTDNGARHVAAVVNGLAWATEAYASELLGFGPTVIISEEAAAASAGPRIGALTVISVLFTGQVFCCVYLLLLLLRRGRRGAGG